MPLIDWTRSARGALAYRATMRIMLVNWSTAVAVNDSGLKDYVTPGSPLLPPPWRARRACDRWD